MMSVNLPCIIVYWQNTYIKKQVEILISKNQALQTLYLKHIKRLHKLAIMDRNPRKFNPHKRYCTVLLLYYNSK